MKPLLLTFIFTFIISACGPVTPVASLPTPNPTNTKDLILEWHRDGGFAGFCDIVKVYFNGTYFVSSCNQALVLGGEMNTLQIALMRRYASAYKSFQYNHSDKAVADGMSVSLAFYGTGTKSATDEDIRILTTLMAELQAQAVSAYQANSASALATLTDYLKALNTKDYIRAAKLYGGSTETLTTWNPSANKNDLPALLKLGCENNGLNCLKMRSSTLKSNDGKGTYHFVVQFSNLDGTLFQQGPCCGELGGNPITEFIFTVVHKNDMWFVMELPPYTPLKSLTAKTPRITKEHQVF